MRKAILAVLLAGSFIASFEASAVMLIGAGTDSCGKWVSDGRNGARPSPARMQWVLGYLSGGASALGKDVLAPNTVDYASISLWMDNYCRDHPLEPIERAATELFMELLKAKAK